jgi:hypothetical protein
MLPHCKIHTEGHKDHKDGFSTAGKRTNEDTIFRRFCLCGLRELPVQFSFFFGAFCDFLRLLFPNHV